MKLSMWILYDWLQKYHPEPMISHGEQILRSARILSADTAIEHQNVYLARASEFISGEDEKTICVHGEDMLLLNIADMETVLNDIFDAFDYYNSWADGISGEIRNGCDVQKLVDLSEEVFRQPIMVFNTDNKIIGISSAFPKGSLDKEWDFVLENRSNSLDFLLNIQDLLKKQRTLYDIQTIRVPATPYLSVYKGIFHDRVWLGRIILLEAFHTLSKGEVQLFQTFCSLIEYWAADSYKSDLLKAETQIFQDLIEGRAVSPEELHHKLQMAGWEKEDEKELIRIEIPQQKSEIAQVLSSRLEKIFLSSYIISAQNAILILVNLELIRQEKIKELLKPVLKQTGLYAVSSYPFTDISELAGYNEQCKLTCLHCPSSPGILFSCSDYALDSIRSFIAAKIPGTLKHPGLKRLQQFDADNHSDLYRTLYTYLHSSCNMAETSRQMHLHRNSLLYRLNQIREITGVRLEDPDIREHLLFSYYM